MTALKGITEQEMVKLPALMWGTTVRL